MNNKENTGKTIGVVHVVYLSIIFTGVVVWLVSYIFGGSSYAGSLLTFAATLSSILLAVIAIIITLIDVAGQRNNIMDVKTSVEELNEVTAEITKIVNGFEEQMRVRDEQIISTIQDYDEKSVNNINKIEEITDKISKIKLSDESTKELDAIKEELEQVKAKIKAPIIKTNEVNNHPKIQRIESRVQLEPSNKSSNDFRNAKNIVWKKFDK